MTNPILLEVTNRVNQKKLEYIRKDLNRLSSEQHLMNIQIRNVNKVYDKLLMKTEPVGSSLKAIRHLR